MDKACTLMTMDGYSFKQHFFIICNYNKQIFIYKIIINRPAFVQSNLLNVTTFGTQKIVVT